jgi:triphosphoribosyl-dephospho-CoA synthase
VFVTGAEALIRARPLGRAWAIMEVFLAFLAAFPDSHIARRHGAFKAEEVRRAAESLRARVPAVQPAHFTDLLLDWDRQLNGTNINPGTSADLTVATLFVAHLHGLPHDGLPPRRNSD